MAATFVGGSFLQAAPSIDHVGLKCIQPGTYAVVLSGINPELDVQTAKVYFRSILYPDFYYVEMTREDDDFVGILPQPSAETPRVVYYVEAVDQSFESARSAEFDPLVEDPCTDRPPAAYLPQSPGIVVGAVSAGASALPPGFSAAGIVGTITALGVSSGLGSGIGAGAAVAVAAGVGGGVVGAVVVTQAEETASTTTVASTTVRSTTTTTASPSAPTTTVPTTTVPGSTTSSSTTTSAPGSPSTTTTVGPATTTTPATTTPTTTIPVSTSVPASTTTSIAVAPLNPDCFTVQVLGECRVRLDATCVNPPVDRYDWVLDTEDNFKKETVSSGPVSFNFQWDDDDCKNDENITFFLEVRRGASRVSAQKTIRVPGEALKALGSLSRSVRLETHLALPPMDGSAYGRVLLNGTLVRVVDSAHPVVMDLERAPRENVLEAVVERAPGEPGTWRFELGEGKDLRVIEGALLALEPHGVVFRLSGASGERLRFSFVLEP